MMNESNNRYENNPILVILFFHRFFFPELLAKKKNKLLSLQCIKIEKINKYVNPVSKWIRGDRTVPCIGIPSAYFTVF